MNNHATTLEFETLPVEALSAEDVGSWREIVRASEVIDSPFLSYGYARLCAKAYGATQITIARTSLGQAVGFLPWMYPSTPGRLVGMAERIGGGMTDYFAPVVARDAEVGLDSLLENSALCGITVSHLDGRLIDNASDYVAEGNSPLAVLHDGFDAYWDDLRSANKSRCDDLMRRRRKLEKDYGTLTFTLEDCGSESDIDRIIELKRQQYERTSVRDVFAKPENRKLLHVLAAEKDEEVSLVVSTLKAGENWAASHIGVRMGSVLHYWFPVYNEALKRASPGRLLVLELLRAMPEADMHLLDFGLGESRAKLEFANASRALLKGAWFRNNARGHIAHGYQSLRWRLGI